MDLIYRFARDEAGATAVEYALLVTFISLAIIGSLTVFGQAIKNSYETSTTSLFGGGS
jgi:pilus assembly protein Flp/PilA